jgi:ParB/RepB/Spo0J family partition protein
MSKAQLQNVPIKKISPNPNQPRRHFSGLEELAESIKNEGLLTPILLRPKGNGYEIVSGERRYRAAKLAGLTELPAQVQELDDQRAFELAVVENLQRDNLTPMEEAEAFQALQAREMTQTQIAQLIGKSQSYVAQKLRLLQLPPPFQHFLSVGALTENHIRQILKIKRIMGTVKSSRYDLDLIKEPVDEDGAFFFFVRIRPEDVPPVWSAKPVPVVVEACNLWMEYVSQHNEGERVDRWLEIAFWYACLAASSGASVSLLGKHIDLWHERQLWAWMYTVYILPDDMGEYTPEHWCYHSDARHSGMLGRSFEDFSEEDRDFIRTQMKLYMDLGEDEELKVPYPSALQPWAQ